MHSGELVESIIGWSEEKKWQTYSQLEVFEMALSLDEVQEFNFGISSYLDKTYFKENYIITYKDGEVEVTFSYYWKTKLAGWDLPIHIAEFINQIMKHFNLTFS